MKFVCSNCSTQYLISDDKVGSKGVKVRCKRCGNVIIVRPPSQDEEEEQPLATDPGLSQGSDEVSDPFEQDTGDEVGQAFDQLLAGGLDGGDEEDEDNSDDRATEVFNLNDYNRSESSFDERHKIDQVFAEAESTELPRDSDRSEDKAQWYVAIGDEQVGPISLTEIEARWRDGAINRKTLTWCPGMDNWLPMGEVKALGDLLNELSRETRDKTDVNPTGSTEEDASDKDEGDLWAPYQGSELASLVEEEMAAVESSPPAEEEQDEGDILGGAIDDDGEIPPWEQEDGPSVVAAKSDDSFFDSTLDASAGGGSDGAYGRSGVLAGPAYLGTPKSNSSKNKWILIGALSGIVLIGGAVVTYFMFGHKEEQHQDLKPVVPPDIGSKANDNRKKDELKKDKAGNTPDAGSKVAAKGDAKKSGSGTDEDKTKAGQEKNTHEMVVAKPSVDIHKKGGKDQKAPVKKSQEKRRKKKKRNGKVAKNTKSGVSHKKESPVTSPSGTDSSLPKKLSKKQIGKTMMEYVGSMRSCVLDQHRRDPTVTGVMKLSFTIQPNGRVKGIKVLTKQHAGTYVAGCISYIIKSIHFPKAQEPSKVPNLPLKLGG